MLARASFGVLGANVAAVIRALVACGWFGIQAWIGGEAISTLLATLAPGWKNFPYGPAVCFFIFWLINLAVVLKGIEYIRMLQGISAPVLAWRGVASAGVGLSRGGGFGPMLVGAVAIHNLSRISEIPDSRTEWHSRFWATVSLNIPDFTRFARNQREQIIGQALALPTTMTLVCVCGNRRDVGNGCDLRNGDLGSGSTAQPVPFSRGSRDFAGCDSAGDSECQHRRKCRFASERFFQFVAARHQLPNRRRDHVFYGHCDDAVETVVELPDVHPRMAWRLCGVSRARWPAS